MVTASLGVVETPLTTGQSTRCESHTGDFKTGDYLAGRYGDYSRLVTFCETVKFDSNICLGVEACHSLRTSP